MESPNIMSNDSSSDLVVFTDGSTYNNGKKSAVGGAAIVWPNHESYNQHYDVENPTNNICELYAVLKALEVADSIDSSKGKKLIIYTDSLLIVNTFNEWITKWKSNGFMTSSKKPIKNQGLIMQIDNLLKKRKTDIKHVKAHTGQTDYFSFYNDKADKLAQTHLSN